MFEAAKTLVPQGQIEFPPSCPKNEVLILENGGEKRLTPEEINALNQLDLMKEEIVSMVKTKTKSGNVTYGLMPERKNLHDDRNYTFIMFCWYVQYLNEQEIIGMDAGIDYQQRFFDNNMNQAVKDLNNQGNTASSTGWGSFFGKGGGVTKRGSASPFSGSNPFK